MKILLIFLILSVLGTINGNYLEYSDPSYDHQNTTYISHIEPINIVDNFTVTPFFSPDHSSGVQTNIVLDAKEYVNIICPSWDSWDNSCNDGCAPQVQRDNETFPVWQALLNAVHDGINIRILTNDYNTTYPNPGTIDPLTFLFLNGVQIRYFTTLTFDHVKYIASETQTSVSSVNFDFTSYMQNREAGVVLSGSGSAALQELYNSTFWADWNQAFDFVPNQEYTSEQMEIITNTSRIPVVIPERPDLSTYDTPLDNITGRINATAFVSPDFAYTFVSNAISAAKYNLYVYMYDTSGQMCDLLQTLPKTIVTNTKILVSPNIDGSSAYDAAQDCYKDLYYYGYNIQLAPSVFPYAHQKFWIIDYGYAEANMFVTSGNWVDEDLPNGSGTFPPYTNSSWRETNRDFNFHTTDANIIDVFYNTLMQDYKDGTEWYPSD